LHDIFEDDVNHPGVFLGEGAHDEVEGDDGDEHEVKFKTHDEEDGQDNEQ